MAAFILLVFSGMFFVGAWFVNSDTVIESEGRKATKFYKPVSMKKREIMKFFSELDKFITDRLLFKDAIFRSVSLVLTNHFFDFDIEKAFAGKEEWYFLGNSSDRVLDKHIRNLAIQEESFKKVDELAVLNEMSQSIGADFAVVICPDKHAIYGEYFPDYIKHMWDKSSGRYVAQVADLLRNRHVLVIDLFDPVYAGKQTGIVFHRTDTHWNILGASTGFETMYRDLHSHLKYARIREYAGFPEFVLEKTASMQNGDLVRIGGFYNVRLGNDDNYKVVFTEDYPIQWTVNGRQETAPVSKMRWTANPQETSFAHPLEMKNAHAFNKMQVVVICDSFMMALSPFFNAAFSDIVYISDGLSVKEKQAIIRKYKPELVIYEAVGRRV